MCISIWTDESERQKKGKRSRKDQKGTRNERRGETEGESFDWPTKETNVCNSGALG